MKELEAGQKLRIKFNTSSLHTESLMCTVKGFEDDRAALVFPEDHNNLRRSLPEGKEIEAVVYTDSGIYAFDSIVINSPLEYDFVIELPDEKKHIQRRDYVRAPFNLRMQLIKNGTAIETKTINIGGGGIRFSTKDELKDNEIRDFVLYLPDNTIAKGKGIVLYSFLQGKTIISVIKFVDIGETDRNRIIKKCFEEEVKGLRFKKAVS